MHIEISINDLYLMLGAAVRYSLPRQTYISSACAEWCCTYAKYLNEDMRKGLIKDILREIDEINAIDLPYWKKALDVLGYPYIEIVNAPLLEKIREHHIKEYLDGRVDAENAASYLGFSSKTLSMWRSQGTGPKFIKRGRIFYYKKDLDEWLDKNNSSSSVRQEGFKRKK